MFVGEEAAAEDDDDNCCGDAEEEEDADEAGELDEDCVARPPGSEVRLGSGVELCCPWEWRHGRRCCFGFGRLA